MMLITMLFVNVTASFLESVTGRWMVQNLD